MKRILKPAYLPPAVLALGIGAFWMRQWLFNMGRDERSLLATGSFPDVMSWILVIFALVLLVVGVWKLKGENEYEQNFRADPVSALSMVLAAVGFGYSTVMSLDPTNDTFATICIIFGFLAVLALLVLAWFRLKGIRPNMLLHTIVCAYLMLHLVSHYRQWSAYPQLQNYAFELLAMVFMMLACYQRAAFDGGIGKRRSYTFCTLAALFFCIATLPGCDDPVFFTGCAAWMLFTPCRLNVSAPEES